MTSSHGKKIGTLEVKLDRKKTRYERASVEVELRFDITHGSFWAVYEGNWYDADTKAALTEKIKAAATKALSIEWQRYIQIDYEASGWPIEKSGRPESSGRYHEFDLSEDRSKFDDEDEDEKYVICGIQLHWSICEISEPYPLPEDPKKLVRACRRVGVHAWGSDKGQEQIGDPEEWEDAVLPPGTLLWTPDREAVLVEVVAALGRLDARLVDLFAGDAAALAGRIDAAAQADPSRLLAAPTTESDPAPKKQPLRKRGRS